MKNYRCALTLHSVLKSGVERGKETEIVTFKGKRLNYYQLNERVHRLGAALSRLGVGKETRVAVLEWDTHRYLEAYFAIPMLGATLMTVNMRLSVDLVRYTLEHSGCQVLIVAAEFAELYEQVMADSALELQVIVIDKNEAASFATARDYETLLAAADPSFQFPDVDEDTVATHFYTTGTTGLPKGVVYTHRQLVTHTLAVGFAMGMADDYQAFRAGDVYMPLTPMFHVHAWGVPYVATLMGVKQVYPGRYDMQAIPHIVKDEGVTFSHCVPAILFMILENMEQEGLKLPGWKVMVGGSPMPPALAARALRSDLQPFAGYGMSETCPVVLMSKTSRAEADADPALLCDVGFPLPLVTMALDGDTPDDGTSPREGELLSQAPWLTELYYNDPERTDELWQGGYLHTGDIAARDEQGRYRIVDRIKDVIKTGGEWLSSVALESLMLEHPAVAEAAVIAIPDERWGERPCGFVKLKPGTYDNDEVTEGLRTVFRAAIDEGKLPRYATPDQFRFVDEIPKTSVGKLNKRQLRADMGL